MSNDIDTPQNYDEEIAENEAYYWESHNDDNEELGWQESIDTESSVHCPSQQDEPLPNHPWPMKALHDQGPNYDY